MIRLIFCFFVVLLLAFPAQADDYAKPDWPNLARTLIRFNAINIGDDKVLDDYAAITECDLYNHFYRDDFKWNEVRNTIRQSIKINIATFPLNYYYDQKLQLGRYDFQQKIFNFAQKSTISNVNTFVLYEVEGPACGYVEVKDIPSSYRAVLDTPLYFAGLPLADKDAQVLLKQMKEDKNDDRIVYTRFNLRIVYVEPMHKEVRETSSKKEDIYTQSNRGDKQNIRLDARLDSIDFYEDAAMTKLIYHYQQF